MERGGRRGGRGTHFRREFHARSARNPSQEPNSSFLVKPASFVTWRSLMKRHEEILYEKSTSLQEIEYRKIELEKTKNTRCKNILSESESMKEKVKDIEFPRLEGVEAENSKGVLKDEMQSSVIQANGDGGKAIVDLEKNEEFQSKLSDNESRVNKEIDEQKENLEIKRDALIDKFIAEERKLEIEIQKFYQEIENQIGIIERRIRFDPILARNKLLERELNQRDQTIHHLSQYIEELEDRSRMHMDQIQQMSSDFNYEKSQIIQRHENEKASLISQAKCEGVTEFISGDWQGIAGYNASNNSLQISSSYSTEISPCYQPMRQSNGSILTDLRDRYEDIRVKALFENNEEKYRETLAMIRSVVTYYESLGMRVYEESTSNKCIATLIWCPNDLLYPNKTDGFFAIGNGDTDEEATENAIQWAHSYIQNLNTSESNSNSETTDSVETDIGDREIFSDFPVSYGDCSNFDLPANNLKQFNPKSVHFSIPSVSNSESLMMENGNTSVNNITNENEGVQDSSKTTTCNITEGICKHSESEQLALHSDSTNVSSVIHQSKQLDIAIIEESGWQVTRMS